MQLDRGKSTFPNSSTRSREMALHISHVVQGSVQGQMSEKNLSPCSSRASGDTHTYPHLPHTYLTPVEANPGLSAELRPCMAIKHNCPFTFTMRRELIDPDPRCHPKEDASVPALGRGKCPAWRQPELQALILQGGHVCIP
ncbi:hypothetical protein WISP_73497 [Willisornis vidua]|uniref:Uncharacterized protein n=1 Tax=Willisornis vidua TaxID=1566151 RepID=A0ABQ9D6T7_9PASS|nr:hypothetical protein WISP_73497 [Willisornis vidua]